MKRVPKVNFIETTPPAHLTQYIEAFWHCRITEKSTIRLLPTACSDLMVCRTATGTELLLVGPMSTSQLARVNPGELFIGVRFKPGCRLTFQTQEYALLKNTTAHEGLTNLPLMNEFERSVGHLTSPQKIKTQLQLLIKVLIAQKLIGQDEVVERFIANAKANDNYTRVEDLLANLPMSNRHFRRRFMQYTCFRPKEFLRVYRQQNAIAELKLNNTTVTDLAAKHGYADHAHFSHEFRRSIGVAPVAFDQEITLK